MLIPTVPSLSSRRKAVYDPKTFVPHAASLRQGFPHCARFPTAAPRRSLGRVSVPVWPVTLSGRLPVAALVSHYLTNKLIGRESLDQRLTAFPARGLPLAGVCGINVPFGTVSPTHRQVTHVLRTRVPLTPTEVGARSTCMF